MMVDPLRRIKELEAEVEDLKKLSAIDAELLRLYKSYIVELKAIISGENEPEKMIDEWSSCPECGHVFSGKE